MPKLKKQKKKERKKETKQNNSNKTVYDVIYIREKISF